MSCSRPELSEKLLLYVEKELSVEEEQEIRTHIFQCPQCGAEVEGLKMMLSGLKAKGEAPSTFAVHPTADEMTRFFYSRENLNEKERLQIAEHVFQCPQCMEEMKLLLECPDIDGSIASDETVKVPVELAGAYRQLYSGRNRPELVTVESIKPHSLWDRLWKILTPQFRFAYASAFVLLILIMSMVVVMGPSFIPGIRNGESILSYRGTSKFVEFPMEQIDSKDKDGFTLYLINNGVPVQIQDGKILVRKDHMDEVREQLAAFRDKNIIELASAEGTGVPSDFIPAAKGGSPPDKTSGNNAKSPTEAIHTPPLPDLAEALEGSKTYPTASPTSVARTSKTPVSKKIAKGKSKSGSGEEWIPLPKVDKEEKPHSGTVLVHSPGNVNGRTADLRTSIRVQNAFLEMESDYKENSRSFSGEMESKNTNSFLDSKPRNRTAGSDSGMISSSHIDDNDVPLSLDELEARERSTERIQSELKNKIQNILDQNTSLPKCRVKVFVTLSFQKDQLNKYMVRSVTIHIEHSGNLTDSQKERLRINIRKELKWQDLWDERFVFEPV